MKISTLVSCLLAAVGLANLSLSFVGAAMPDQNLVAPNDTPAVRDDRVTPGSAIAIETPIENNTNHESQTPGDATPTIENAAEPTVADLAVPETNTSQVLLHFKLFSLSTRRVAETGIDLTAILANKTNDASSPESINPASANIDTIVSTISPRERELLIKLLKVSGAAKLLAEPTLLAESGRKAKFFSGAEVPAPGPPENGVATTESRDVGTTIEVTASQHDPRTIVADLRVDFSEIDLSFQVPPNGFMFPPVKSRWVQMTVPLSIGETTVIGGRMPDGLFVMVTPEFNVSEEGSSETPTTLFKHDLEKAAEYSSISRQMERLQNSIESVQFAVKELAGRVDKRLAAKVDPPANAVSHWPLERVAVPSESRVGAVPHQANLGANERLSQSLSLSTELIEPKSGHVRTGDPVTVHVTVTNTGSQTLANVRARMIAQDGTERLPRHSSDIFSALQKLAPGESKLLGFDFVAEREGYATNTIEVVAEGGHIARLVQMVLVTEPTSNQKSTDRRLTNWPYDVGGDSNRGVQSGWELSPEAEPLYTIRIGSGLYKPLSEGSAVQVELDSEARQLRKFRVVIGADSSQASAIASDRSDAADYGWRRNTDGCLDYYVQIRREKFVSSAKGVTLNCEVHPDVDSINRIYVFLGDAKLPRQAAP